MTADTALPPISDDSIARLQLVAPVIVWPKNVPSTKTAMRLMFDAEQLSGALYTPTLELLKALTERNLATPPKGLGVDEWMKALAITWRLKVAAVLAKHARSHDETALQELFDEAATVRELLLTLANDPAFGSQLEAQALRGLLQAAWGEVLDNAPAPPPSAQPRPLARTGMTGVSRIPTAPRAKAVTQPQFKPVGQPLKLKTPLMVAAALLVVLARIFLIEGDLESPPEPHPTLASPGLSEHSPEK